MIDIGGLAALAERLRWIAGGLSNPADAAIVQQYASEMANQPRSFRPQIAHCTVASGGYRYEP